MNNNKSQQIYIETIWLLTQQKSFVRRIDIAKELNYSKASITNAIKKLINNNLVYLNNNHIYLTDEGLSIAKNLSSKQEILTKYFISLGANSSTAILNSQNISRCITDDLFRIIKEKLEKTNIFDK